MSFTSRFLAFHQSVYVRTDGRLGHHLIGVPSLILRTTGARTGEPRTAVLTYGQEGGEYVIVASNGGQDRPPAWLANVRSTAAVEMQVGRERSAATARVVASGDPDYPALWALMNRVNKGRYDAYQRTTSRPIALVAIRPSAA